MNLDANVQNVQTYNAIRRTFDVSTSGAAACSSRTSRARSAGTRPQDSEEGKPIGRIISARKATAHERKAYEEGSF